MSLWVGPEAQIGPAKVRSVIITDTFNYGLDVCNSIHYPDWGGGTSLAVEMILNVETVCLINMSWKLIPSN